MEGFNKYIPFIDYGDVIWILKKNYSISDEDAFYFYEFCCDKGLLRECKTDEEVYTSCVNLWAEHRKEWED